MIWKIYINKKNFTDNEEIITQNDIQPFLDTTMQR